MGKITGFLFFLILAAGAAFAVYASWPPSLWGEEKEIAVIKPVTGPAVQAVYATGTVEPSVMVPVAPRITARLMELTVDEGQIVEKDEVLARLESEDLQQSVKEMQAAASLAQKEYKRKAELVQSGAISKKSADEAKTNWETAQARVAQARSSLGYAQLVSPEKGVVIRRDGEVGELIPANQPVFYLSCCAGLRIASEVDEEDISLVKPGQKVVIRADAFPGKIFEGAVQSITPKGDPVSRSYRVRISLGQETPLLIGMTAETNIVIREEKQALLVPASAVNENTVRLLRDGKILEQKVQTGAETTQEVEILGGLSADDTLLLDAAQTVEPGKMIKTKLQDWKAP